MTNRPPRSILLTTTLGLLVLIAVCSSHFIPQVAAGHGQGPQKKIATQLLERHPGHLAVEETAEVIIQLRSGKGDALLSFLVHRRPPLKVWEREHRRQGSVRAASAG